MAKIGRTRSSQYKAMLYSKSNEAYYRYTPTQQFHMRKI